MATIEIGPRTRRSTAYIPQPATIVAVETMTELEKWFAIELESGALDHAPGQFVQVYLPGIGECPISICSSPTRPGGFELCIRRVGGVTAQLHACKPGDVVGIRGPLGNGFDVRELAGLDLLLVVGGLGLAPARSLIQYVLDRRDSFGRFDLLYGARSPTELLFRDDLVLWEADPSVNLRVTVDTPDPQWRGRSGVVTTLFKLLEPPDPQRTAVVVIGPPIMFKFVVLEALAMGVPQKRVYCSLERRMRCGIGKCGHCQANQIYVCLEGPVFRYGQLKALREALE